MAVPISSMHTKFRISFDSMDTYSAPEYTPEDIDILLNESQDELITPLLTREGYESNQTSTDYLANLIKTADITSFAYPASKPYGYYISLPSDYRKMLLEEAQVKIPDCHPVKSGEIENKEYMVISGVVTYDGSAYAAGQIFRGNNISTFSKTAGTEVREVILKRVPVIPQSRDVYSRVISNPFKVSNENKLLRLESSKLSNAGPQIYEIVSSQNVIPSNYYIDYYMSPPQMQYGTQYASPNTGSDIDCYLNDEACNLIVQMAVTKAKKIISQEYQVFEKELTKLEIN